MGKLNNVELEFLSYFDIKEKKLGFTDLQSGKPYILVGSLSRGKEEIFVYDANGTTISIFFNARTGRFIKIIQGDQEYSIRTGINELNHLNMVVAAGKHGSKDKEKYSIRTVVDTSDDTFIKTFVNDPDQKERGLVVKFGFDGIDVVDTQAIKSQKSGTTSYVEALEDMLERIDNLPTEYKEFFTRILPLLGSTIPNALFDGEAQAISNYYNAKIENINDLRDKKLRDNISASATKIDKINARFDIKTATVNDKRNSRLIRNFEARNMFGKQQVK